ncbi:MAG: LysE family transporter [Deltaproteobacteria bacterium]|nr:LysE family transporter [Deltaproteobacteria bacterium]
MYLAEFLTVVVVHLLAVMSPGPDFVMICRNSVVHSRQAGVYSAVGLGLGIVVHVTYSLVGIGFVIAKSLLLFTLLKYVGAAYLIYLGYQCLRAPLLQPHPRDGHARGELGQWAALRMGFLTNVLNPKATLFFFALFTLVIHPQTPKGIQILYGLEMSVMTFVWFALVATLLSHQRIRMRFTSIQHQLERAFGVILVALAVKVALSVRP